MLTRHACFLPSRYDDGGKGFLDRGDLRRVLADLGLLDDVQDKEQFVASQFALADRAQSAALSLPDFSTYYDSLVFAGATARLPPGCAVPRAGGLSHLITASDLLQPTISSSVGGGEHKARADMAAFALRR